MPATELQQMIDVVAKDKGIDPSLVITAIEDAYLAASRKVFRGDEDLRTRFNLETGQVELYAVRQIVADVTNPAKEISLSEAQQLYGTIGQQQELWRPLIWILFAVIGVEFLLSTLGGHKTTDEEPLTIGERIRSFSPGAWAGRMTGAGTGD